MGWFWRHRRHLGRLAIPGSIVLLTVTVVSVSIQRGVAEGRVRAEREAMETRLAEARDRIAREEQDERRAILELVECYRLGASPRWRQRLADAIWNESRQAQVDPLIVAAIVAEESSFLSRAVSHRGAVGLMQLRPWVAEDVARRREIDWDGVSTLHTPETNVRLGIEYYKELLDRFRGDPHRALTAYNMGPTEVGRQLRAGTFSSSDYARDILALYERLRAEREPEPEPEPVPRPS